MAETVLTQLPALPFAPARLDARGVGLSARPEGHVLQVIARRGVTIAADRLADLGDGGPHAVRVLAPGAEAPGQWLIVGDGVLTPDAVRARASAIADVAHLTDLSHARVRIGVEGVDAEDLLATGIGIDPREATFPVGASASMLFEHLSIHLTRTGGQAFEIVVARSFATSLWDALTGHHAG